MTTKTKRIVSTVLMAIPAFVLSMGGVMKLIGAEPEVVMQFLTQAGFGKYLIPLGLTELLITGLLLYPKTTKIGFSLVSCYLGGALCLELSGGQPPVSAIFLMILWIAMFLRNKDMFLSSSVEIQ